MNRPNWTASFWKFVSVTAQIMIVIIIIIVIITRNHRLLLDLAKSAKEVEIPPVNFSRCERLFRVNWFPVNFFR